MNLENNNTQSAENQETEQETNVDATENQETEQQEEKTFTQAELDKMIGERLKRERSKTPSKDELNEFKEWKKSQQTEQERIAEERKEAENLRQELTRLKNEKAVMKNGVDSKFTDYVTYEVSKMEGDFEENLKEFLSSNEHFSSKQTTQSTTPTTPAGGQKIKNEAGKIDPSKLSDREYYEWKKKNKT